MEWAQWLVLKTVLCLCSEAVFPVCYSHDFKSQFEGTGNSGFTPVPLQPWVWSAELPKLPVIMVVWIKGFVSLLLRMPAILEIKWDSQPNLHRLSNYQPDAIKGHQLLVRYGQNYLLQKIPSSVEEMMPWRTDLPLAMLQPCRCEAQEVLHN